jgi:serine/threonine protein kinase
MATDSPDLLSRIDDLERAQREPLPRVFGPYLLLRSLAKGGMGEVFFARSGTVQGFEKHCVVKTLRPHLTDDREYVTRFIDEARVVVQLNHKNVCQVFDVGLVGERYYLAMELIAGQDLRTLADAVVARGQPFPPALALHIIAEVLEALDYAHRKNDVAGQPLNLVHRDISPQNVMISYEGEVKLIDFGLAASSVKVEKTSPNLVMGKLAYMSVEQLRGEAVDRSADLFATAVMLTELLLGERYYAGLTPHATWSQAAVGTHRPERYLELDAELRAILDRALHADKNARYPDGLALRTALLQWRTKQGLWADGPALRALMQDIFADALREHHHLLQDSARISRRTMPAVDEPSRSLLRRTSGAVLASASGITFLEPLPNTTTASAPRLIPEVQGEPSTTLPPMVRAQLPLGSTEPTQAVVAAAFAPDPARRGLIAAVAGLVVVVVALLMWRVLEPAPAVTTTPVVVVDAGVVNARPVVTAVEPVGPAGVDAGPTPSAEPSTPTPTPTPTPSPSPTPSPTPTAPKVKAKADKLDKKQPATPSNSTSATTTKPQPSIVWDDYNPAEQAGLLKRLCPKLACAIDLDARKSSWAKGDAMSMGRFRTDITACRKQCGRL